MGYLDYVTPKIRSYISERAQARTSLPSRRTFDINDIPPEPDYYAPEPVFEPPIEPPPAYETPFTPSVTPFGRFSDPLTPRPFVEPVFEPFAGPSVNPVQMRQQQANVLNANYGDQWPTPEYEPGIENLFRPGIPEESNPLRRIPIIGDEAARITSGMTTPAGIIASGPALVSPVAAGLGLAGVAGSFGAGLAGQGLEELGVQPVDVGPFSIGPRGAGEIIGGFATPGMLTAPGRAFRSGIGRGVEESGGVTGLGRRLVDEERGAIRIGGQEPEASRPLTQAAEDLLASVDEGAGQPAFISRRLSQIARENDIPVTGRTTPDDIVNELRGRRYINDTLAERATIAPEEATSGLDSAASRESSLVGLDTPEPLPPGVSSAGLGADDGLRGDLGPDYDGIRSPESPSALVEDATGIAPTAGRPLRNGLDNLVEDAEKAAKSGDDLPPPPSRPTTSGSDFPPEGSREIPFPRPSTLHTVEEVAADARRSTQNYIGATARVAGKVPPIKSVLEAVNPSAFWMDPPKEIVRELDSLGRAQELMTNLGAYNRKIEQANAHLSATGDAIRQAARSAGLKVKDARVVSIEGSPFVGDLFENPSRYAMTPKQRQFVDDVDSLLKDMAATEKAAGVKRGEIFSEEGRYFPRSVQSSGDISSIRGPVRQNVGAKQGFQKERFYESMAEGNENGVNYRGDISALVTTRLRAGLKAVSDKEIEKLLAPVGRIPTEADPSRFGEMGTTLAGLGSRVFRQNTAVQIMESLTAKGAPPGLLAPARIFNAIQIPLRATGDISLTLLQALPTAYRNPAAFLKAVGYELDGLLYDGRLYGGYLQKNARWVERFTAAGGEMRGSEMTWSGNVSGQWMRRLFTPVRPLTSRFDNAFTNGANVAALENFKAMVGVGDSAGSDFLRKAGQVAFGNLSGETSDEVAASIASKMTGRMSTRALGVSQAQQQAEGLIAFAPKFYRATIGLVGDAVQGGMRGAEARRVLGSLIAGAGATYAGVSAAMGQAPRWDPRKSDFLTVEVNGQRVGFGGPLHGMLRAVAKGIDNPSNLDNLDMKNPLVAWLRGRSSPIVGLLTDMITGKDFLGMPIDRSPEGIAKYVGRDSLPFAAQSAIEEGGTAALATGLGLRAFPVSPSERRNEIAQEQFGKKYAELDISERQKVDASSEVQKASAEIDQRQRKQGDTFQKTQDQIAAYRATQRADQEKDDAAAQSGTMDIKEWKNNYYTRQAQTGDVADQLYKAAGIDFKDKANLPPERAALEEYFKVDPEAYRDPATREIDSDKFWAAREQALAGLTSGQRAAVQAEIDKYLTPFAKEAKTASTLHRAMPVKYSGMDQGQQDRYYDFQRQIDERKKELYDETKRVYPEKRIARMLAEESGDTETYMWYRKLSSPRRARYYTAPEYNEYLLAHRDQLERFYPTLYTASSLRRMERGTTRISSRAA